MDPVAYTFAWLSAVATVFVLVGISDGILLVVYLERNTRPLAASAAVETDFKKPRASVL